jgi:hypothetical protein
MPPSSPQSPQVRTHQVLWKEKLARPWPAPLPVFSGGSATISQPSAPDGSLPMISIRYTQPMSVASQFGTLARGRPAFHRLRAGARAIAGVAYASPVAGHYVAPARQSRTRAHEARAAGIVATHTQRRGRYVSPSEGHQLAEVFSTSGEIVDNAMTANRYWAVFRKASQRTRSCSPMVRSHHGRGARRCRPRKGTVRDPDGAWRHNDKGGPHQDQQCGPIGQDRPSHQQPPRTSLIASLSFASSVRRSGNLITRAA